MVNIIFESHGTTTDNEMGLSSGHFDAPLSALGEQQAKELGGRYIHDKSIAAIFCSDLSRSYHTAEIAFEGRSLPIIQDARLKECDYGDLTRAPKEQVDSVKGQYVDTRFPNGESWQNTADRMHAFLQDVLREYESKTILIIGHRATQYGLECWIRGVPLFNAVSAPWQWQPGWRYALERV